MLTNNYNPLSLQEKHTLSLDRYRDSYMQKIQEVLYLFHPKQTVDIALDIHADTQDINLLKAALSSKDIDDGYEDLPVFH